MLQGSRVQARYGAQQPPARREFATRVAVASSSASRRYFAVLVSAGAFAKALFGSEMSLYARTVTRQAVHNDIFALFHERVRRINITITTSAFCPVLPPELHTPLRLMLRCL